MTHNGRKRGFIIVFAALALMICTVAAIALLTSCGSTAAGEYGTETRGGHLFITSFSQPAELENAEYTVPKKINGTEVYGIAGEAYKNCTFSSLIIPEGIVIIEDSAFSGCVNLETVTISSSVEEIEGAFKLCNSISDMKFGGDRFINENGIVYTKDKKTVILSLKGAVPTGSTLTIPDTVEHICAYAFNRAEMSAIVLPSGIKTIGEQAFYSCKSLTSLSIDCPELMIGTFAFGYCADLTTLNIKNVFSIGEDAFRRCNNLKTVEAENVDYIGNGAFRMCGGLTTVSISGSYNYIPADLFSGDSMLDDCMLDGDFGSDRVNMYDGNEINTINNSAFSGCTALPAPIIPDGIVKIGPYAFNQCSFKSVYIPEGIKYISEMAFYECETMTSLRISSTVVSIGFQAFAYDEALTKVTIPANVKELGIMSFYSCYKLSDITLEEGGCETMGVLCFGNCVSLNTLRLPASFKNVRATDEFFMSDIKEEMTYDFTVHADGSKSTVYEVSKYSYGYSFVIENNIDYVTIDNAEDALAVKDVEGGVEITGVKEGYKAYLSGHPTLIIPSEIGGKKVVSIASGALSDFRTVEKLTLPEGIKDIGEGALKGMIVLKSVKLTGSDPAAVSFSASAADNMTLITIYVPARAYDGYAAKFNTIFGDKVPVVIDPDSLFVFTEYGNGLRVVSLIDGAEKIGITSISVPEKYNGKDILAISGGAFSRAVDVTDIYIPGTVTRIYDGAFAGCTALKYIHLVTDAGKTVVGSGLLSGTEGVKVCVPERFATNYLASYDWEGITIKSE